jgi:hypothetical protein
MSPQQSANFHARIPIWMNMIQEAIDNAYKNPQTPKRLSNRSTLPEVADFFASLCVKSFQEEAEAVVRKRSDRPEANQYLAVRDELFQVEAPVVSEPPAKKKFISPPVTPGKVSVTQSQTRSSKRVVSVPQAPVITEAPLQAPVMSKRSVPQAPVITEAPLEVTSKRKRDVSVPPSEKDESDDQSEEMKATLQALNATQEGLTIELLNNQSNASNTGPSPSGMSFIQFSKLESESDNHLFHRLRVLRPKMLQDWFLNSVIIISIAAHHFEIETVSRQKLEKFYSQHKQLGSSRNFYRHRGVFRFFKCLITLVQSLKVKDADFFITELLKHLETTQLQVAWVQKRVLEILGQRLAQWSMDGTIVFDSRILFDSKLFNSKALSEICKKEGCNGPASTDHCWYHSLAHQGLESRLKNIEIGAKFALYATKDLDVGTRFEYNGDRISRSKRSGNTTRIHPLTILDTHEWHLCPMRYLTHAVQIEANCDWLDTSVCVVRLVSKDEELTIDMEPKF